MAVKLMKLGAFDFIEKPFMDEDLINNIKAAFMLDQQRNNQNASNANIKDKVTELTEREREVFDQIIQGHPNKVIARNLEISPRTVEIHRAHVMRKLQARNLSHLVKMAVSAGIG